MGVRGPGAARRTMRSWLPHRMDELIMFRPLSQGDVREIVKLQLHQLLANLEEKGYQLIPSEELIEHIGSTGFDPQFGARPIKRMIQKELLNELSRQIIAGTLEPGVEQVIDVFDGKIVVRKPVGEKESRLEGRDDNGNGKARKSKAEV